ARTAGRDRTVVADKLAGEGGEDRREGDRPWPLRNLPDGRGRRAARAVQPPPRTDREAAAARPSPMLTLEGCNGGPPAVELRLGGVLGVPEEILSNGVDAGCAGWRPSRSSLCDG